MKYFNFLLAVVLMFGCVAPVKYVSARDYDYSHNQNSTQNDDDDENKNEVDDSDKDWSIKGNSLNQGIVSETTSTRIKLLQDLIALLTLLLEQYKSSNTTSTVTTTPVASSTPQMYTVALVAAHNRASDCWSIVNSKVYNLTSYVQRHPGGAQNIIGICGKDGTSAFAGQHGGDPKPENILSGFYLGEIGTGVK